MATERLRLRTVGIDIGTTTSHLIFSELVLERQGIRLSSAYSVVERKVIHRSKVLLTPYASALRIDTEALRTFIDRSYEEAGWPRDTVDSGAVIATGEAARKENAAAIVALFSDQGGKFVCATAGHHLECLLAAHGSGAVVRSQSKALSPILNVDIGGGTTKFAICRSGRVEETAAIDVGARLVSWEPNGRIRDVTLAGRRMAAAAGVTLRAGDVADDAVLDRIAAEIADTIMQVPRGVPYADPMIWLTDPLTERGPFTNVVFSGGVGEYVNGGEQAEYGDLGRRLGRALAQRTAGLTLFPPAESIRATCIGASQYTVQVSGDTLFLSDPSKLPLRDLAAITVRPEKPDAAAIATEIRRGIARLDREDGAYALAVRWPHGPAYGVLRELCHGIAEGTKGTLSADRPLVIVLDADLAGIVGQIMQEEHGVASPIICVDQIALSDLDFIDIGARLPEKQVVPVVVKSLIFADR